MKDNYDLFVQHEAENAKWLSKRPCCVKCGEPIQEEVAYDIDGLYCRQCVDRWLDDLAVDVEDLIEEGET